MTHDSNSNPNWGDIDLGSSEPRVPSRRDRSATRAVGGGSDAAGRRPSPTVQTRAQKRAGGAPRPGRGSGPRRAGLGCVAAAAAIVLLLLVGSVGLAWIFLSPGSTTTAERGSTVTVEIPQGSGTATIGEILAESGVVGNANMFRVMSRLADADGTYKAGVYQLTVGLGYNGAIEALQAGPRSEFVTVTLPEGLTIHLMAVILEDEVGIPYDEFTALARSAAPQFEDKYPFVTGAYDGSLEGFLFPDTYQIDVGATTEDVLDMMLARFGEVWEELSKPSDRLDRYTINEIVTIASMVEREASLDRERPLVASVVDNRLDDGMKLQFCSTVQFLLPGEEARTKIRLTNDDISIQSPYNTYINKGLPPGPIANPGREALDAALHPADTNYIYFVLTGTDGSQTFTSSYAEFERAKQKSKEVLGQ